jgi:hypothetical protein
MIPFVIGALVGATAVVALNNNEKVKKQVSDSAKKLKDAAVDGASKLKEKYPDVKKSVEKKLDCLSSDTKQVKNDG